MPSSSTSRVGEKRAERNRSEALDIRGWTSSRCEETLKQGNSRGGKRNIPTLGLSFTESRRKKDKKITSIRRVPLCATAVSSLELLTWPPNSTFTRAAQLLNFLLNALNRIFGCYNFFIRLRSELNEPCLTQIPIPVRDDLYQNDYSCKSETRALIRVTDEKSELDFS